MDYWDRYLTGQVRNSAPGTRLTQAMAAARSLHPTASQSNVHPITEPAVTEITPRYVVDDAASPTEDYGLGQGWGARWRETAQGWRSEDGTWRPIVTTTATFDEFEIDTYLGLVSGEATVRIDVVESALGGVLDQAREVALDAVVDVAVTRGAHAVIASELDYTPLDHRMLVTVTGTAVTLKAR